MVVAAACAGAAAMGGCADPESAVGFEEKDPAARLRAIRQAASTNDASAIPSLISLLQSDDAAERLLAIRALERMTGETRGYDHAAPLDERNAAVERWATWYASTSGGTGGTGDDTRAPTPPRIERRNPG